MAIEIERKYLTKNESWINESTSKVRYSQGYMTLDGDKNSVRVRVTDEKAWINFKSATLGIRRLEFEYPIPLEDARQMLVELCHSPMIEKDRYLVPHGEHMWEIDVFLGDNDGLVVAEIELESEEQEYTKPVWLGKEVTDDERYYNVCLVRTPFKDW